MVTPMAEHSGIAWTTHTFNAWVGCTKVGPGCDHCYAENWNARFGGGVAPNWGPGAPRRRTSIKTWNKVLRWQRDRRAAIERGEKPEPVRVFCASLADVFDNEVPDEWRADLWNLIRACPDLEWQLVTKRVGNVRRMAPWGGLPPNVIIIATIVNQVEADRDLEKLTDLARLGLVYSVGISYEPALGPIDWSPYTIALDWIIVGGESDQGAAKARPFEIEWARSTVDQCRKAGVPVFVKQLGSNPLLDGHPPCPALRDRAGSDPVEWPEDLRIRQFPLMNGASRG
jgi:protein gp37